MKQIDDFFSFLPIDYKYLIPLIIILLLLLEVRRRKTLGRIKKETAKKIERLIMGTTIVLAVFYSFIMSRNDEEKRLQEEMVYPRIDKINREIAGRIYSIKPSAFLSGSVALIQLKDSTAFSLWANRIDDNLKPFNISDLIEINDSIYKPADNDSVYIYRNNKTYYFLVEGNISTKK